MTVNKTKTKGKQTHKAVSGARALPNHIKYARTKLAMRRKIHQRLLSPLQPHAG